MTNIFINSYKGYQQNIPRAINTISYGISTQNPGGYKGYQHNIPKDMNKVKMFINLIDIPLGYQQGY